MDPEELQSRECRATDDRAAMCLPDTAIAGHDSARDAPRRDALDQATSDLVGVDPTTVQSLPDDALQSHNPWPIPRPMLPLDHRSISSPSPEEHALAEAERRREAAEPIPTDPGIPSIIRRPPRPEAPRAQTPRPPAREDDDGPQTGEGFGIRGRGQTSDAPDATLSQADFSVLGRAGVWVDPQDDEEYRGIRVRGGVTGNLESRDEDNPAEVHGSALSVDAGVYSTDETLTIGAGVSAIEGGGTFTPDFQNFSRDRDDDLAVGVQGGIGPGAALRIHHGGDRDDDGHEELGFGVSVCDFGFDVRSETLGRHARNARRNINRWGETIGSWFDDPQPAGERPPGDPQA